MKRLLVLREKRKDLIATMRGLLDAHGDNPPPEIYAKLETQLKGLDTDIAIEEGKAAEQDKQARAAAARGRAVPVTDAWPLSPWRSSASWSDAPRGRRGALFADLFADVTPDEGTADALAAASAFTNGQEFLRSVGRGLAHPGLMGASFHESSGPDGGWLTPEEMVRALFDTALESEIVRPRARVYPMRSSVLNIVVWDDLNRAGAVTFGGLKGASVPEEGTIPEKTGKLRRIQFEAKKVGFILPASNESLDDSGAAGDLEMAMSGSLSFTLDDLFLRAAGQGTPLGILNSTALITVAKEGGQGANTILYANLAKMFGRLLPSSVGRAVWVAHPSAIPVLLQIAIPAGGAATSFYPVLNEQNGSFSIFGRPLLVSEKMAPLSTKFDILLADFSRYVIGIRREITIDRSQHVGFSKDQTHFRVLVRVDGMPMDSSPITPSYGTDTLSAFVTLEAR